MSKAWLQRFVGRHLLIPLGLTTVVTSALLAGIPVGPTTSGFHGDFAALVQATRQTWPVVPPVSGSAGNSMWGDLALRELLQTPDGSFYAVTTRDPFPLVGLDPEHFQASTPASYKSKLDVYTTWIHESAHQTFLEGFDPWCAANPGPCADYQLCYKVAQGGGGPGDKDVTDPCSEEYAYQKEGESLSDECARLCADESLSPEERDQQLADLNEKIKDVRDKWSDANGLCEFCALHGVPLPEDFGDTTPPTQCECQP